MTLLYIVLVISLYFLYNILVNTSIPKSVNNKLLLRTNEDFIEIYDEWLENKILKARILSWSQRLYISHKDSAKFENKCKEEHVLCFLLWSNPAGRVYAIGDSIENMGEELLGLKITLPKDTIKKIEELRAIKQIEELKVVKPNTKKEVYSDEKEFKTTIANLSADLQRQLHALLKKKVSVDFTILKKKIIFTVSIFDIQTKNVLETYRQLFWEYEYHNKINIDDTIINALIAKHISDLKPFTEHETSVANVDTFETKLI